MKKLSSEDLRNIWKNFWENWEKDHKYLKYSSLIPDSKDKTVLFNTAWMQQLVSYLLGKPHPLWNRLYNIQKSLRTWDIDEVGDERHLTFFEMFGNWSLWDFFKKESLTWSVEFLNKEIWISIEKIWATIFAWDETLWIWEDIEARKILNEIWIPNSRIKAIWMEDNFRGPAGELGPCWPCSEFFVDRGEEWWKNNWDMWENDRFIEVWNNVFMEFYKNEDWTFSKLKQKNVDTGMWLERLAMILQNKQTVFETDLFEFIMISLQNFVWKKYAPFQKHENEFDQQEKNDTRHFRIIADHIRTAIFMIWDWVIASNDGRWYVLRRLIRRFYYSLISLNENIKLDDFINDLVNKVNQKYWTYYIEISNGVNNIISSILNEIYQFQKTINNWIREFEKIVKEIKNSDNPNRNYLTWEEAFKLYDTYWLPVDMIEELAFQTWFSEKWLNPVSFIEFEKAMEKAREKSRKSSKDMFKRWIDWAKYLDWISPTEFVWYENLELEWIKILKDFEVNWQRVIIFDKTPFYAESGGQTSDIGILEFDDNNVLNIYEVQNYSGVFLHFIK